MAALIFSEGFGKPESSPTADVDRAPPTEAENADPDSPFPLPLPEFPPRRPTGEHRLVVVPLGLAEFPDPPDWAKKLGSDDPNQIVQLTSANDNGNFSADVRALLSDGTVWRPTGKPDGDSRIVRIIGNLELRADGRLYQNGQPQTELSHSPLAEVSTGPRILGIAANGTVAILDPRGSHPREEPFAEYISKLSDVVFATTSTGNGFGASLHRDGSVSFWTNPSTGFQAEKKPENSAIFLGPGGSFAISPDRSLLFIPDHQGIAQPVVDSIQKPLRWVGGWDWDGKVGRGLAAIAENGEVVLWMNTLPTTEARANSQLESSVRGASEIYGSHGHLFALLPADTVSRSGYWGVDDLIADRKKLQEANQ